MEPKGSKAMTWLFMTFLTESQVTSLSMVSPIFFQEMTSRFICLETALSHFAAAVEADADLLLVHHGLFWDGLKPLTGRRYRRVKPLLDQQVLYLLLKGALTLRDEGFEVLGCEGIA